MRRLLNEIDLHVVAVLVIVVPPMAAISCLRPSPGWVWVAVVLLIPQGLICVRAFGGYPTVGKRFWLYLIGNELLVFGVVGLTVAIRRVVGWITANAV